MIPGKLMIFVASLSAMLFLEPFNPEGGPRATSADPLLPHVLPEMETPDFWIGKLSHPDRLLLDAEEIQRMNDRNVKSPDFYLFSVKDLQETYTRNELLALFEEDLQGFGPTDEIRYGEQGRPLGESFWANLKRNFNQESLRENNPLRFGLIVNRTDLRVFPTDEPSMKSPSDDEFDRFQHSSVSPGSLVGIYHVSRDRKWAYIQTHFVRGWVHAMDVAIAKQKRDALDYAESRDRLVMTGSYVKTFADPSLRRVVFSAPMGASFPILNPHEKAATSGSLYVLRIPSRDRNGRLSFGKGYIPKTADVHHGFLPYTQENVARQAFKMLHEPYGWGDKLGGRDCSKFMMDLFSTFGIVLPRNSKYQAMIGKDLGAVEGKDLQEKLKVLNRAIPLVTLVRLPGHITLYLGKHEERHYVIHSLWGVETTGPEGPVVERVARVVVSDLSLGESGPRGSLLDRATDIRSIERNGPTP